MSRAFIAIKCQNILHHTVADNFRSCRQEFRIFLFATKGFSVTILECLTNNRLHVTHFASNSVYEMKEYAEYFVLPAVYGITEEMAYDCAAVILSA